MSHPAAPPSSSEEAKSSSKFTWLVRALITIAAIGGAVAHLVWPRLNVDSILVALLLVAVVPWLGYVLESLELPGGTKMKFREMEQRIKATEQVTQVASAEARGASQIADFAVGAAARPAAGRLDITSPADGESELSRLISEYNEIRRTRESSPARTSALTQIVGQMAGAAKDLQDFDFAQRLESQDDGQRLSAYARLFALPEAKQLRALVTAVTNLESTAFGQYWGIQAIGKVLAVAHAREQVAVVPQLRAFLGRLKEGTDRHYELTKILMSLGEQ